MASIQQTKNLKAFIEAGFPSEKLEMTEKSESTEIMEAIIKNDLPLSEQQFFDSIISKGLFKKGFLTPEFAKNLQMKLKTDILASEFDKPQFEQDYDDSLQNNREENMKPKSPFVNQVVETTDSNPKKNESMSSVFKPPKPKTKSNQSMSQTLLKKHPAKPNLREIEEAPKNRNIDPIEEKDEADHNIKKTPKSKENVSMSNAFKRPTNLREREEAPTNSGQEPIEEEDEDESEDSPFLKSRITKDHFSYYQQNIEMDIYIITGYFIMIFLPCLLLFITYIIQNLMKLCKCLKDKPDEVIEPKERVKFIFVSLFFLAFTALVIGVCVFPGIFVIITQYFCMLYLVEYSVYDPESQINSLQILLVMILIFMDSQEISQGVNTGYYLFNLLTKSVKKEDIEELEPNKKFRAHAFVTVSKLIFSDFPHNSKTCGDSIVTSLSFNHFIKH